MTPAGSFPLERARDAVDRFTLTGVMECPRDTDGDGDCCRPCASLRFSSFLVRRHTSLRRTGRKGDGDETTCIHQSDSTSRATSD